MDQSTIYLNFKENVVKYPNNIALAYIESGSYKKINYKKLNDYILILVKYFSNIGLKQGDKIVILSENVWQWPAIDMACNYLGIVVVPIHATYGKMYIEYIVSQVEPKVIFISSQKLFDNFSSINSEIILNLEKIITINSDIKTDIKVENINNILSNKDIDNLPEPISTDGLSTIIYTSGTTGLPKGVMLSNSNILSDIKNVLKYDPIYSTDRFFSLLTLSHVLERTAGQTVPLLVGGSIYYSRSTKTLLEDIKLAKPTIFICVPRIFERVFDKIQDNLRKTHGIKSSLFYYALKAKSKLHSLKRANKKVNSLFYLLCIILDKIVFGKIRNIFGGNIRMAISGGSSLDKRIARFFEDVGISIIEGYGLTETSPIISVNKLDNYKFGTVGLVLENLDIKIQDDKEILVRGDSVMNGYFKDDESTSLAIDSEKWFHTGDLGFIDKDGFLNIIGRKKELIVLSTGKKVLPVNIEQALNYDKYINQSIVIGNNEKFLTALIVPDFEEVERYCKESNINIDDKKSYLNLDRIENFYRNRINECLKGFADYEQIVYFYLVNRQFDEDHDELTPTLKLKRGKIKEHFNNIIKEFYKR